MLNIHSANFDDIESVYALVCELENETFDRNIFAEIYRANILNPNIHYIIAYEKEQAIAFASLHIEKLLHHCAPVGEIQELIVSKNQRCKGIGSMLFKKIKEIAKKQNCQNLELCCNMKRRQAHAFYLRQGMVLDHYNFILQL